jgi:ribonuclease PH
MEKIVTRKNKRAFDELRELRVTYDIFDFADASLLFESGRTKVMCAITLQSGVPHFLRGEKVGWLTAEYAMLPAATRPRTQRDAQGARLNQRNIEISRIIGRTLRAVCDLAQLGEYTIMVDCDVLQADAGTRAACISAASAALACAQEVWLQKGIIDQPILKENLAAVSVGFAKGTMVLDPDYAQETLMDADINFIVTQSQKIIEIQGGAEKNSFSWDDLQRMYQLATKGAQEIFAFFGYDQKQEKLKDTASVVQSGPDKAPFFSLQNRISQPK